MMSKDELRGLASRAIDELSPLAVRLGLLEPLPDGWVRLTLLGQAVFRTLLVVQAGAITNDYCVGIRLADEVQFAARSVTAGVTDEVGPLLILRRGQPPGPDDDMFTLLDVGDFIRVVNNMLASGEASAEHRLACFHGVSARRGSKRASASSLPKNASS
jgi:hypothetical protein